MVSTSLARQLRTQATDSNATAEYILKNHVLMEFYIHDMFTEKITNVPAYGLWHLLSDIGGVTGLFLGASLFSFIVFFKSSVLRVYLYIRNSDGPWNAIKKNLKKP
eukprot:sb/3477800/